ARCSMAGARAAVASAVARAVVRTAATATCRSMAVGEVVRRTEARRTTWTTTFPSEAEYLESAGRRYRSGTVFPVWKPTWGQVTDLCISLSRAILLNIRDFSGERASPAARSKNILNRQLRGIPA